MILGKKSGNLYLQLTFWLDLVITITELQNLGRIGRLGENDHMGKKNQAPNNSELLQLDSENCWFPSNSSDITYKIATPPAASSLDSRPYHQSVDQEVAFRQDSTTALPIVARALGTSSGKRKFRSLSLRFSGNDRTPSPKKNPPIKRHVDLRTTPLVISGQEKHGFCPEVVADVVADLMHLYWVPRSNDEQKAKQNNAPLTFCQEWHGNVEENPSGLIIVAGGTGTGKSTYAKAILMRWLLRLANKRFFKKLNASSGCLGENKVEEYTPPNLITFENPIESWVFYDCANGQSGADTKIDLLAHLESDIEVGIRLTARQSPDDIDGGIEQAFVDVLRQKPAVVYIGECRQEVEWKTAIQMAATGHLVVTTCHAASLVDTFAKLSGNDGKDAYSRRQLASSILGCLHLQQGALGELDGTCLSGLNKGQTFFSLWRRTEESVSNFVSDGLSSIIPDSQIVFSRQSLVKRLVELSNNRVHNYTLPYQPPKDGLDRFEYYKNLGRELTRVARHLDQDGF